MYATFLDGSKAFDRVRFDKLFELLIDQECRVNWCNEVSHNFRVCNGVKQGGVLSPLLFNIYIDVLLERLAKASVTSFINRAVTGRFFVDAYFSTSAGHRRIFSTLNHVVKVMQRTPAGHRWETVRPPPICSANDKISGRCPTGVRTTMGKRPSGNCRDACWSPADNNKSYYHRQVTV